MEIAQMEKKTVVLSNCAVKENAYDGDALELIVSSRTKIMPLLKKFKVDNTVKVVMKCTCELVDIAEKDVNSIIEVKGKVLSVGEIVSVNSRAKSKNLKKQDCILSDKSGTCKVVLWEDNVNRLEFAVSYELCYLVV